MSNVLARFRGESIMEFQNTAHELEKATIEFTKKYIPKAYTFKITNPLCASARLINQYVMYANEIFPTNNEEYLERKRFMKKAKIEIKNYLEILRIASEILPIKDSALEIVVGHAYVEESSLKGVIEADRKRFSKLQ